LTNAEQHQSLSEGYLSQSRWKPPSQKRSYTRSNAGQRQTERYENAFLAKSVTFCNNSGHAPSMAYQAELQTDMNSGDVDIQDPRVYSTKNKSYPNIPSVYEALNGEHADRYMEAMKQEIQSLIQKSTWTTVQRSEAKKKIIKSTWVFKLKRLPDGAPSKFKAIFCVQGDLQEEGVD
jgi:hypothetical protein